jgi:hypothetical protein
MRTTLLCLAICVTGSSAYAASCATEAANKKLAGAAKTSFMTKCEKDAEAACAAQAGDKKLAGAAKASFTSKCVRDAVGG